MLKRDFSRPPCECYENCECEDDDSCICVCSCEPEDIQVIVGSDTNTQGFLPFYSVDTREEVDALVEEAIRRGEFYRRDDGALIETTLAHEQTLENLNLAGERLHAIWLDMQETKTK